MNLSLKEAKKDFIAAAGTMKSSDVSYEDRIRMTKFATTAGRLLTGRPLEDLNDVKSTLMDLDAYYKETQKWKSIFQKDLSHWATITDVDVEQSNPYAKVLKVLRCYKDIIRYMSGMDSNYYKVF